MRPSGLLRRVSSSGNKPQRNPDAVEPFTNHSSTTQPTSPRQTKSSSLHASYQPHSAHSADGSSARASASASAYAPSHTSTSSARRASDAFSAEPSVSPTLVDSSSASSTSSEAEEDRVPISANSAQAHHRTTLVPAKGNAPELGVFHSSSPSNSPPQQQQQQQQRPSLASTKLRAFGGSSSELLRGWAKRSSAPSSPDASEDEKHLGPTKHRKSSGGHHHRTGSASLRRPDLRKWIGRTRRWRATVTSWRALVALSLVALVVLGWGRGQGGASAQASRQFGHARSWLVSQGGSGLPWQLSREAKARAREEEDATRAERKASPPPPKASTTPKRAGSSLSKPKPKAKPKKITPKVDNPLALGSVPRRIKYGANLISVIDPDSDEVEQDNSLLDKIPTAREREQMFEEARVEYYEEADYWKEYSWQKTEADASLGRVVEALSEEERAIRQWIRATRTSLKPPSRPVGLVSEGSALWEATKLQGDPAPLNEEQGSSSRSRPHANAAAAADEPAPPAAPPSFSGAGSIDKWTRLLDEANSAHGGVCRGSNWLSEYEALHASMLSGAREPKVISYHCEKGMNCGGLGDRLLGMTSAFFFALVTNRAFLAEWQTPVPLDAVFDSASVDWSYSTFATDHPVLGNASLLEKQADLDIIHFNRWQMDKTFGTVPWTPSPSAVKARLTKGMELRDLAFRAPWIRFFSNRGMVYKSFSYKHLQPRIAQLGLKPMTAFACILDYLFRPKPAVQEVIADYTSVLNLPSVFSVGIQIRTGDMSMRDPHYDLLNTVQAHEGFFTCADQLAETYALPGQKVVYFLVTDSAHLRHHALQTFADRVVISGAEIEHIHVRDGHANGVHNAVLEEWILAKTDYRVITQDSGFGKLASFASGQRASTVTIGVADPSADKNVKGAKKGKQVDCRLEGAFTTFDQLASEWSLG